MWITWRRGGVRPLEVLCAVSFRRSLCILRESDLVPIVDSFSTMVSRRLSELDRVNCSYGDELPVLVLLFSSSSRTGDAIELLCGR